MCGRNGSNFIDCNVSKSRFQIFLDNIQEIGIDKYRENMKLTGTFEFEDMCGSLEVLQNKLSLDRLVYLFGDETETGKRMPDHYMQKFVHHGRNLLLFLNNMDRNQRFFILYSLKNDKDFIHK